MRGEDQARACRAHGLVRLAPPRTQMQVLVQVQVQALVHWQRAQLAPVQPPQQAQAQAR